VSRIQQVRVQISARRATILTWNPSLCSLVAPEHCFKLLHSYYFNFLLFSTQYSTMHIQGDQNVSVYLMITVHKHAKKMAITEYFRNLDSAMLNTDLENRVRRVNKCPKACGGYFEHYFNFLYCNRQVHRDFLITLYIYTPMSTFSYRQRL
jgi:hypothetical protein